MNTDFASDDTGLTLRPTSRGKIIGKSDPLQHLFGSVDRVARANCTVLVTGPVLVGSFLPVRPTTPAIATFALSATAIAYIYFVAPRIVVAEDAIRVQNSWREHVVPWGALVDIETRFNLTLVTPEGRVHVQAAPSPGGLTAMRSRPDQDRATTRATGRADTCMPTNDPLGSLVNDHDSADAPWTAYRKPPSSSGPSRSATGSRNPSPSPASGHHRPPGFSSVGRPDTTSTRWFRSGRSRCSGRVQTWPCRRVTSKPSADNPAPRAAFWWKQ